MLKFAVQIELGGCTVKVLSNKQFMEEISAAGKSQCERTLRLVFQVTRQCQYKEVMGPYKSANACLGKHTLGKDKHTEPRIGKALHF